MKKIRIFAMPLRKKSKLKTYKQIEVCGHNGFPHSKMAKL